jgi:hypothetical protein
MLQVLVLTSCLYIACYMPSVVMALACYTVPNEGFMPWGRYANLFHLSMVICKSLAGVNGAGTFIIYWTRSQKYRNTFHACFSCSVRKAKQKTVPKLFMLSHISA